MSPEITIVIPYHNESGTIEYTLERVGKQTLAAKEAIFVNSSSTDDSFEIVEHWIKNNQYKYATCFRNIFESTDNPASSKNVGIRNCRTEWIAFMDCGQNFDPDWLEKQYQYATSHNVELVSGVVYLVGENWVDRCSAAQTYGYKRNRPCVPTSLLKKSIFEQTGLFLEKRRAGYDAAWPIVLKRLGIKRGINPEVKIKYKGYNFSGNIRHLLKKSILYAKPTVGIKGYYVPYLYPLFALLILSSLIFSFELLLSLILIYFLSRTFFIPIFKSRNVKIYTEHPAEALALPLIGFIIDFGKLVGILQGMKFYFIDSKKQNLNAAK